MNKTITLSQQLVYIYNLVWSNNSINQKRGLAFNQWRLIDTQEKHSEHSKEHQPNTTQTGLAYLLLREELTGHSPFRTPLKSRAKNTIHSLVICMKKMLVNSSVKSRLNIFPVLDVIRQMSFVNLNLATFKFHWWQVKKLLYIFQFL